MGVSSRQSPHNLPGFMFRIDLFSLIFLFPDLSQGSDDRLSRAQVCGAQRGAGEVYCSCYVIYHGLTRGLGLRQTFLQIIYELKMLLTDRLMD